MSPNLELLMLTTNFNVNKKTNVVKWGYCTKKCKCDAMNSGLAMEKLILNWSTFVNFLCELTNEKTDIDQGRNAWNVQTWKGTFNVFPDT